MNIRLIATQVGDTLKYDATVNEIGRAAAALFRFNKEAFPNESITSQRAQLVYDWIMTLGKQAMEEDRRGSLLAQFCLSIAPEQHRAAVERILVEGGVASVTATKEERLAFAARGLHPEVVKHGQSLFLQRNYFHSVFECSKAYNKAVREKARSSKDGQDLMLAVWGADKGVLKVTPGKTDTDRNVQEGIKFLSAGLMAAIRNPTAHEPAVEWPIGRDDCLDVLSFLSFLYRKLDAAVYHAG
ncbi:MAG: TIGR02391 family protein [Gemmatimonadota bacterium]